MSPRAPGVSRPGLDSAAVPTLVKIGIAELALGALAGWLVVMTLEKPEWLREHGVKQAPRLRQAHLDWIMMGTILTAVGASVPDIPDAIAVPVVFGALVNPTLFFPLAFWPDVSKRMPYRVLSVISFLAVSGGLTALAVHVIASG
jgi:hypothetical protein